MQVTPQSMTVGKSTGAVCPGILKPGKLSKVMSATTPFLIFGIGEIAGDPVEPELMGKQLFFVTLVFRK
jgi:hypothetical protein